ncbi:hypothetical protein ACWEO2_39870 [Nocardia sp. NPDC004278]
MSQGLGTVQRRLLVALYCAENFNGRWMEMAIHPDLDTGDDLGSWFAISQFHLVETDHAKRFAYAAKRTTVPRDREFKRSRRVPYRRALRTLEQRGLAEARLISVDLNLLGQWAYRWHGRPPATREVWVARLTEQGMAWVRKNAPEQVQPLGDRMVRSGDRFDPEHRWQLEDSRRRARRHRSTTITTSEKPTTGRAKALNKNEVVDLLQREGTSAERVRTVLREWHREEQRQHRLQFGEPGPSLDEHIFGSAEVDDLRSRLS